MQSTETPGVPMESAGEFSQSSPQTPLKIPIWVKVVPLFLSALLFISGIFAVFSPLPLLLLFFQRGRKWAWMAALTNATLVYFGTGPTAFQFYIVFVLSISLSLPEFLKARLSLEKSALSALAILMVSALLLISVYGFLHHISPWMEMRAQVSSLVDYMVLNLSPEAKEQWMGTTDPVEWKQNMLIELPSAIGLVALVLVWANLSLLLRLNPQRIREQLGLDAKFLQRWKAPGFLVWPTILAGFLLLGDWGVPSEVALNVFKLLMAVYAIQGLAILSFLFDVWNIRGFFRSVGFIVAVFLMMPLLLSVGFFDQWFDFRAKFRQS